MQLALLLPIAQPAIAAPAGEEPPGSPNLVRLQESDWPRDWHAPHACVPISHLLRIMGSHHPYALHAGWGRDHHF